MKLVKSLCFIFAISSATLFAQNSAVENEGAGCSVNLPTAFNTANSKLPDPFKKLNGDRMTTKEEWTCRREEIKKLAERTIYGEKPVKPTSVTGTVSNTKITVNVTEGSKNASFSATVTLPTGGNAPYPAVVLYGGSGADATTIRGQGVATINYTPTDVGGETGNRTKSGLFYNIYGTNSKTGTLAAWAWGVSRIIDVIEQSGGSILKADAIGVTGCSRYGKGAFAAGVFDQRIALTIPVEGGTGGVAIMRGAVKESGAQSPSSAFSEQPWLGDDFNAFQSSTNNLSNLPVDMHEAVAMVAPRGLLILDKPGAADWLASRSGYASAMAGSEVYKALGYGGNITYHSNNTNGNHCAWINEWKTPVEDNIKRFLLKTASPPAAPTITPKSDRTENMTNWIDWTTPTLSGTYPPGASGNSSSSVGSSSSITHSSSSSANSQICGEYQPSFCGGMDYASVLDNSTAIPSTGECLFIEDFGEIQPALSSTVSINGEENTCGEAWADCDYNTKPDAKDGGYYVYVKTGTINSYQNNGWQDIVAKAKPDCKPTLIATYSPSTVNSKLPRYYNIKGEPLGSIKPATPGVYLVKQGSSVRKIVVR